MFIYHYFANLNSIGYFSTNVDVNKPVWVIIFRQFVTYAIIAISVLGGITNVYVLIQQVKILRKNTGTPNWVLAFMSATDILLLMALGPVSYFFENIIFNQPVPHNWDGLKNFYSVIQLYLIETASSYKIWCWVVLSILRYCAIVHPLSYFSNHKFQKTPTILASVVLACAGLETWIFFMFQYDTEGTTCCNVVAATPKNLVKGFMAFENLFSHWTPAVIIIVIDLIVLNMPHQDTENVGIGGNVVQASVDLTSTGFSLTKSSLQGNTDQEGNGKTKKCGKTSSSKILSQLKKYLGLAMLEIILNSPVSILNLVGIIYMPQSFTNDASLTEILIGTSYILYYAQFCLHFLFWYMIIREPKHTTILNGYKKPQLMLECRPISGSLVNYATAAHVMKRQSSATDSASV